jgi:hypothetical protein
MPLRIHHGNIFVSGEACCLFNEAHPEQDFSDFWLEVSLRFSMDCFDLSSFFLLIKTRTPLLRTRALRRSRRWSPLAPSLPGSTSPMLAMLRRIAAVNQGMLLNSHSRICNSQCNSEMLSQDFYANKEIKTFS